ncbi:cell division protein FtsW [Pediococcus argentinicus]|nr:cell division protein FtsW [Pediococcus argentinicus]
MKKFKYMDYWIFIPFIILSLFGVIMVYSASADYYLLNGIGAKSYLFKQLMFVLVGVLVVAFMFFLKESKLRDKRFLTYFAAAIFISYVYLLKWGQNINGATGWISLGPINVQPSEVCKFFFVIYLSNILSRHSERVEMEPNTFEYYKSPLILVLVFVFLNFLQRDLGGTSINLAIALVIFLAAGLDYRKGIGFIFAGAASFVVLLPIVVSKINVHTSNYMLQRLVGFAHPFELAKGAGNQLVNSYYALGNGGVFGVGLGNSIQKKGYLPEANTDFIMAVVSEELGLVTVLLLIGLLMTIIFRAIRIGIRSNSMYHTLVCYGIATYFTIQTLFNVGGVTGMLPITGVTFPFISYGGSSMLVLSACIGLLLNISASEQKQKQLELEQ